MMMMTKRIAAGIFLVVLPLSTAFVVVPSRPEASAAATTRAGVVVIGGTAATSRQSVSLFSATQPSNVDGDATTYVASASSPPAFQSMMIPNAGVKRMANKAVAGAMTVLMLSFAPFINTITTAQSAVALAATTAESSRIVGSLSGSGLLFKDTLEIEAFDDPKVKGVKLYISNFQIPITERFSTKNFFSDPSYASVACARTGKQVSIADNIGKGPGGEEVFEESKSLLFKTLRVQRIYDEESNTVVYVSFNTRLDKSDDANKSRFKSSLCAVGLD